MPKHTRSVTAALLAAGLAGVPASAQFANDSLDALIDAREIPITLDNFVRAATDIEFDKYIPLTGGVNRFFHFREPVTVDNQPTIRMNRDTLYSVAVIDISEGATLTLPDMGDRYMSAMVVNQDHYINEVFRAGGAHALDTATFETPYVIVFVRTLVDANDPDDVAAVNAFQDQMTIEAAAANPFILPDYDQEGFSVALRAALALGSNFAGDVSRTFGSKAEVSPVKHFLGTAGAWGGLPEREAMYVGYEPRLPVGAYKIEVPADVPVGAFWSVSLYNADGFFEPNPLGAYTVNSVTGMRNDDGSMTVHLGGCDDGRVNCLPLMEGWNYTVRLYEPGLEAIDGSWTFPSSEPVEQSE